MIQKLLLSAIAGACAFAAGNLQAHTGDHSFFQAFDNYQAARTATTQASTAADLASTASAVASTEEIADLFGAVGNENGETLLPPGTLCDNIIIDDNGELTAYFTLPPAIERGELSLYHIETAGALLRHNTMLLDIAGISMEARIAGDSGYEPISAFAPPVIPPSSDLDNRPVDSPTPAKRTRTVALPATQVSGQHPVAHGSSRDGALKDKVVFFSAGHGWTWRGTNWSTQRSLDIQGMNEDLANGDQIEFFAQYLLNSGATVVPMRPIGHQPNEVIIDNLAATFQGDWQASVDTRYWGSATEPYRMAAKDTTETATATYAPAIPAAGLYPVYVWASYGDNRTTDQLYRVHHTAGISEHRINHRRVGNGWIWIGTYYFDQGSNPTSGSVVISNHSSGSTGDTIVADAVRFGNGIGPSGKLRETEAAKYWIRDGHGVGGDPTVYNSVSAGHPTNINDEPNDRPSRSRNASHMTRDDGQGYNAQIYVGWHTNAFDGNVRGSESVVNTSGTTLLNAIAFGTKMSDNWDLHSGIEDDNWEHQAVTTRRAYASGNYPEVSGDNLNNEMCAALIELAFHDNTLDAQLLRDPKVRDAAARSVYQSIVWYFNSYSAAPKPPLTYLPEPPVNFRAVNNGIGGVNLTWSAPPTGGANGHAATGYRIYQSTNGLAYGFVTTTSLTNAVINGLPPGETRYFRLAATNVGGESMPTESLAVRVTASGNASTLVVNGYDRLDRFNNVIEPGTVSTERIRLRRNNSYDYLIEHGTALAAANRDFDSTSNEAVANGSVILSNYDTVVWLLGEENEKDQTLSAAERTALTAYLNNGKRLFISGSELGRHLDQLAGDPAFYNNTLKADLAADDGGGYQATGTAGSALAGLVMNFPPGPDTYDVDAPDSLLPVHGSFPAATYTGPGGSGTAAIEYAGTYRLIYLGFPFEAIDTEASRAAVMTAAMAYFDAANSPVKDWALF